MNRVLEALKRFFVKSEIVKSFEERVVTASDKVELSLEGFRRSRDELVEANEEYAVIEKEMKAEAERKQSETAHEVTRLQAQLQTDLENFDEIEENLMDNKAFNNKIITNLEQFIK